MNINEFWDIITDTKRFSGAEREKQCELLAKKLSQLDKKELNDFAYIYNTLLGDSYRQDLWAATYVLRGGCSDDSFEYIRSWLISMGSEVYSRVLDNPEVLGELVEYNITDFGHLKYFEVVEKTEGAEKSPIEFEEFAYVAMNVYEEKFGEGLPYDYPQEYGTPLHTEAIERADIEWDEATADSIYPALAEKRLASEAMLAAQK